MLNSSLLVSLFTVLVGALSFLNQALLAKWFGATGRMDIYFAATSLPLFVSGTLGGALSYTLTPHLVARRTEAQDFPQYGSTLLGVLTLVSGLLCLLGMAFARQILQVGCPGLAPGSLPEAVAIARVTWLTCLTGVAMVFLSSVLNIESRFLLPVSAAACPYLSMILFGLWFGKAWGPLAVAAGMAGGSLIGAGLLGLISSHYLGRPSLKKIHMVTLGRYAKHMPIYLLAVICFTLIPSVDAYWGTRLPAGSLATLGYAQRILIAVGALVIAGPSAVLIPRLSEAFLLPDKTPFFELVGRLLRLALACSAFMALTMALLAEPTVRLFFGRGAFDQAAIHRLATLLPYSMTTMVPMILLVLSFRVLYARQSVAGPAVVGAGYVVSYFLLSGILSPRFGFLGMGAAYALSSWAALGASLAFTLRGKVEPGKGGHWRFSAALSAALLAVFAALRGLRVLLDPWLSHLVGLALLLGLALLFLLALAVFWAVAIKLLRIPDLAPLQDLAQALFKRRKGPGPLYQAGGQL